MQKRKGPLAQHQAAANRRIIRGYLSNIARVAVFAGYCLLKRASLPVCPGFIALYIVLCLPFVWMFITGFRRRSEIRRFKKHVHLLSYDRDNTVSGLAQGVKLSPKATAKDLQTMIDRNFL